MGRHPQREKVERVAGATGREWIAARRPKLYKLLTVPTGRERDSHGLKFEE
jgi:hypothetical protein